MGAHADYVDATVSDTMRMLLGYFLGTEIHCFFKDTAWLRIEIIHGTSWLRLALQVRGLVCFSAVTSRVYTLV